MHNYEMFIWMLFLLIQWGLIWRKTNTWQCVVALVLSLFFDANMNYVHCINAYNEDLDDDDFWSMFCKPLLYRIIFSVMLHVAALCVFSWKRLLIKKQFMSHFCCPVDLFTTFRAQCMSCVRMESWDGGWVMRCSG